MKIVFVGLAWHANKQKASPKQYTWHNPIYIHTETKTTYAKMTRVAIIS